MKFKNKIFATVSLVLGISMVNATNITSPINHYYKPDTGILLRYLQPIEANPNISTADIRAKLEELQPQNLNAEQNINPNGDDLFDLNSTSTDGQINHTFNYGFTRAQQLQTIFMNIMSLCGQNGNTLVMQVIHGRATQLLNKIRNTHVFGDNKDENFKKLEYELHALVSINATTAYNYLHPENQAQQN